jgi:hypothetical protein
VEALRLIALVVVAGCGRIDFDPHAHDAGDANGPDAGCLGTGAFADIQKVDVASTNDLQTAAFISPDGLSLLWVQSDGTNQHFQITTRPTRTATFSGGNALPGMFTGMDVFNGSLTADQLELYLDSKASGRDCLYRATRTSTAVPFDAAVELAALCATADAAGPQISADGLTLVFNSSLDGAGEGDLYITERPDRASDFPAPKKLAGLPTGIGYPALSADRLRLWFEAETSTGGTKITSAVRISPSDVFSQLHDLTEVDTSDSEGDPSLTLDESQLTFVSQRSGMYEAFTAARPCL